MAAGLKPDRGGVEGTEQGLVAEELQDQARQGSRLVGVFLKAASLAHVARPAGAERPACPAAPRCLPARCLLPLRRPLLASLRGARSTRLRSGSCWGEARLAIEATRQTLPEQVCRSRTPELVLTFLAPAPN